jgi:cytidine deaminase
MARHAAPTISQSTWRKLAAAAEAARRNAHAPYSNYRVGAALLTSRGVVRGCKLMCAPSPFPATASAEPVPTEVGAGTATLTEPLVPRDNNDDYDKIFLNYFDF